MNVLTIDLDNTLIYSYKHDIGPDKINVEIYQGREISFITPATKAFLEKLKSLVLMVPTTTRTIEQYERIDLGVGPFKYALVCNGGILLEDGQINELWLAESQRLISESLEAMKQGMRMLEEEESRYFEIRFINELFVFTKCHEPQLVIQKLQAALDTTKVDVFDNGDKVYIVPKGLNKGAAVKRFKEFVGADKILAAGDSEFDVSMLQAADIALAPKGFNDKYKVANGITEMPGEKLFADELLEELINYIAE